MPREDDGAAAASAQEIVTTSIFTHYQKLLSFDGKIGVPSLEIKVPAAIAKTIQTELSLPTNPSDPDE
jgi:hypothetical protein